MNFHHIGIATDNIEDSLIELKKHLNIVEVSKIVYDDNQDVNLCMITLKDNAKIELISGKIVEKFLKKKQYLYHTCFSVNDIDKTIKNLLSDGAFLIVPPKNAVLFNNKKVAFLMWNLGMIELLEDRD